VTHGTTTAQRRESQKICENIESNLHVSEAIMAYLLDTDTLIYSLKGNAAVHRKFEQHADVPKAISVITYAELLFGARRSQQMIKNLVTVKRIAELFPVLDVTVPVMETFAELKALLYKSGTPLDDMDLIIASTALFHNMIVVTNNEKHFSRIPGLQSENWIG
jgi:tRNA(fMet)-specific endonuclease VapC